MDDPVRIPKGLFARLMAAIETPDDLTNEDRVALLEDADHHYPHDAQDGCCWNCDMPWGKHAVGCPGLVGYSRSS